MSDCNSCGYENIIGANFCSSCGSSFETRKPSDDVTAAYEPVYEDSEIPGASDLPEGALAMLVVYQGPKKGTRIALDEREVIIGRDPESDIYLDDITVSRKHVSISRNGEEFLAKDLGSMNGTYVNKKLVDEVVLHHGDELQIGQFKLVFMTLDVD